VTHIFEKWTIGAPFNKRIFIGGNRFVMIAITNAINIYKRFGKPEAATSLNKIFDRLNLFT